MRVNNKPFKSYDNPAFESIHIQNRETLVKIAYDDLEGLSFSLEFSFNGTHFTKVLDKISNKEKSFSPDEINFDGIELYQIDKEKIAHSLNEILDYYFSN